MTEEEVAAQVRTLVDMVRGSKGELRQACASLISALLDTRDETDKRLTALAQVEQLWREGKTNREITEEMGWQHPVTTRKALSRLGLRANRKEEA